MAQSFTFDDGSQVDVGVDGASVVVFQALAGVQGRGPARMTVTQAADLADAIVNAAHEAGGTAEGAPAEQQPAQEADQASGGAWAPPAEQGS